MAERRAWTREHALALILMVVAASAALITSCGDGGGGGSSNGELCQQCGDTDGPCLSSVTVSGSDAQALCDPGIPACPIQLVCLRELGSAQRRCFPNSGRQPEQFECDGARAQRNTPTPIATPTPTGTPTFTASPTETPASTGPTPTDATPTISLAPTPEPTSTADEECGNGVVDVGEDCDGADLDGSTCEDECFEPGGTLSCNSDCTFDVSGCSDPECGD